MFTIREGQPKDTPIIADFQVAMAKETEGMELDRETVLRGVTGAFEDPVRGKYYVAEQAGEVVASMMVTYEWSDWRAATVLWIQSVFVVKEARGKGAYKALYRHLQAETNEDPRYLGIRLYVARENLGAQKVYETLGMSSDRYILYEWLEY